jgi:lipase
VRLHLHEWGDPAAATLVCLHGITAHGGRYERLARERLGRRWHVVAPDLRGHGRSGYEPPWSLEQHLEDLLESVPEDARLWVGHSFGGRLVLELAARHPELVRRAVLLDPAFHVLPQIAEWAADHERADPAYDSVEAYVDSRENAHGESRERALADMALHVEELPDGRVRRRTSQAAMCSIYGELASEPPPPPAARTLLLYAPAYGLVRDEHVALYDEVVRVPGMHVVMWDAFEETASAVEHFLSEDPGAER